MPLAVFVDSVERGVHMTQPVGLGDGLVTAVGPGHHGGEAAHCPAHRIGAEGGVLVDDRGDGRLHRLQQERRTGGQGEGDQPDLIPHAHPGRDRLPGRGVFVGVLGTGD